jgi:hypothetical protein
MDLPGILKHTIWAVLLLLAGCQSAPPLPTPMAVAILPTPIPLTATPLPTATATTRVPEATAVSPTITPTPIALNGIPLSQIIPLNADTRHNIQATYQYGQQLGRDPHAFSKLGDSAILTDHYLTRFDTATLYNLGPYGRLQFVINHYSGSFSRYGVATRIGLSSFGVLDPLWADKEWCAPDEHMLACEFRLHNPSVLLIRLGTNDAYSPTAFADNLRAILTYSLQNGVIPVLMTKADRFEGDDSNNEVIRQLATEMQIPLWDFDAAASALPNHGLGEDGVHLSMAANNDYTNPDTLTQGYPISDLTALLMLQEILAITGASQP